MMVVAKEDLGLTLGLALPSSTTTTASVTAATTSNYNHNDRSNHHHHHQGFMMMINQNRNHMSPLNNSITTTATTTAAAATSTSPSLFQLNLLTPSSNSSLPTTASSAAGGGGGGGGSSFLQKLQRNLSSDSFPTSDRNSDTCRLFLRGIDVNRPAGGGASAADEEDAGVSSPNSTVSTVSGKRSLGERDSAGAGDDLDNERASSRGLSDDEDGGENSRKKLRLSKDQSAILEESFKEHNTLNPKQKLALAKRLGLRPRQVEVWFQNRRARTKLKQTEVDCEFLKRCCEQLTEENRRLQKEVQELRTLKMSPQFYMQMTPPTTLTMCPSCERVAVPPSAQPKPVPVNPWVTAPGPVRPFARS